MASRPRSVDQSQSNKSKQGLYIRVIECETLDSPDDLRMQRQAQMKSMEDLQLIRSSMNHLKAALVDHDSLQDSPRTRITRELVKRQIRRKTKKIMLKTNPGVRRKKLKSTRSMKKVTPNNDAIEFLNKVVMKEQRSIKQKVLKEDDAKKKKEKELRQEKISKIHQNAGVCLKMQKKISKNYKDIWKKIMKKNEINSQEIDKLAQQPVAFHEYKKRQLFEKLEKSKRNRPDKDRKPDFIRTFSRSKQRQNNKDLFEEIDSKPVAAYEKLYLLQNNQKGMKNVTSFGEFRKLARERRQSKLKQRHNLQERIANNINLNTTRSVTALSPQPSSKTITLIPTTLSLKPTSKANPRRKPTKPLTHQSPSPPNRNSLTPFNPPPTKFQLLNKIVTNCSNLILNEEKDTVKIHEKINSFKEMNHMFDFMYNTAKKVDVKDPMVIENIYLLLNQHIRQKEAEAEIDQADKIKEFSNNLISEEVDKYKVLNEYKQEASDPHRLVAKLEKNKLWKKGSTKTKFFFDTEEIQLS
ncbi:unnamed protein product [Moneuplotes crassus]|uniref:Uncharacterized protein n=1 Tax=Euplotes crassus TaxID=5936 RepID=A0AAD1Y607_EUPCR|nr:unnamed protein product [Moneuplotes crassus]